MTPARTSHDRLHLLAALALGAIFVVHAAVVVRHATIVSPDGADYAVVARNLYRGDGYTESFVPFHAGTYASVRHLPETHGLLRPFELVPLFALFGAGDLALRMPGFVYMASAALVAFWWTRRLFGTAPAYLALGLTLSNAHLFFYSALATDDAGLAFFLIATVVLLWRATQEGQWHLFAVAGLVAALGVLEKPTGVLALVVGLVAVGGLRDVGWARAGRCLAAFAAPVLVAAALYGARNYAAHGGVGFRITPIDWIWRVEGIEGMMGFFEEPPTLAGTLRALGWSRVVAVVVRQVGLFLGMLGSLGPLAGGHPLWTLMVPGFLPALALCGVALWARREPMMSALVAASVVGSVPTLCVLWHFEMRYCSILVPLFAVGVASVLAWTARLGRVARAASVAAAVGILVASVTGLANAERMMPFFSRPVLCPGAVAWIQAETTPQDRILTFEPPVLAWVADRETIMLPSGGAAVIRRVARRYDARWLLAESAPFRPATSKVVAALETGWPGLRLTLAHREARCRVYRVE